MFAWSPRNCLSTKSILYKVCEREVPLTIETVILIILGLALLGTLPSWPYSAGWGYGPSGLIGLILVILLVMVLTGRVPG